MIWIVGANGMLGREVSEILKHYFSSILTTDMDLDITNYEDVRNFVVEKKPSWIINCAAYTTVDKAESEPDAAFALNVSGPANLARAGRIISARLISISTDYVYGSVVNGKNRADPLLENDNTSPQSVYGKTKLQGELGIASETDQFFILRTAWLYGQYGKNFVSTMLRLFKEQNIIKVVDDQIGCPTWTHDLAELIAAIILKDSNAYGTYHFCGDGRTSWYSFAEKIAEISFQMGLINKVPEIIPCKSIDFPTPAKRPLWSVLSTQKVKDTFQISIPSWKESLAEYLKQVLEINNEKKT